MTSMSARRLTTGAAAFALAVLAASAAGPAAGFASGPDGVSPTVRPACADAAGPHEARCFAMVDTAIRQGVDIAGKPAGFGATDLRAAYNLPTTRGAGQLVAVVDAYDDPTAEADLAVYRARYGLPPCTTKNGCFSKVNQNGGTGNLPPRDGGWALEISLDLDMVSAACPKCSIVLIEGDSPTIDDLGTAVDTAARMHASVVTNSYGLDEFAGMRAYFHYYQHPRTAALASSGDYGFGAAQFPAVVPGVTAVGGTSLYRSDNRRGWAELAWSGAGSGCSAYVAKPAYQHDRHCGNRTISDVSAVADPETGVAVYDTTPNPYGIPPGWLVLGGTSASSPLLAGVIGLAGDGHTFTTRHLYRHDSALYDAVGGSNGSCGGDYLCTGKRGYDAPTGLGTPHGSGAF
ncbi:MAG: S53 family peptidase [Nocardioidaceae bacterium]